MCFSLNCLLLGEKYRNSFSVIIGAVIVVPDNNNNFFKVNHNDILVSHFKSLVFDRISDKLKSRNINKSDSLKLWKVDGKKVEVNGEYSTEDNIKNDLGGECMEPQHFLSNYFTEDNFKTKIIKKNVIHIIVQVPATTQQGVAQEAVNLNDVNSIYNWILELNQSNESLKPKPKFVSSFGAEFPLEGRDETLKILFDGDNINLRNGIRQRFDENFKDFYGYTFSSHAEFSAANEQLDANMVKNFELRTIRGIGEAIANNICEKRKIGPFKDKKDLYVRVPGISEQAKKKIKVIKPLFETSTNMDID